MHVVIISHNYPTVVDPSFGFFCKHQAEALAQEGHEVGVVAPLVLSWKSVLSSHRILLGFKNFVDRNVRTYLWSGFSIPGWSSLRYMMINSIGKYMVDRYVKRYGKPDVLHLHVYIAADVAIYAKKKYGIPLFWTEHFSDAARNAISNRDRQLMMRLIKHTADNIAVSNFLASKLESYLRVPFNVLGNVYDSNIFFPQNNILKSQPFTFLSVAYMQPIKNHLRLIEAFERLFDLNVRLVLVGIGEMFEKLQAVVVEKQLNKRVIFLGELDAHAVMVEMNRAHAYVVSSDLETFNVSLVEALACGLPIVSTRCGGPENIVVKDELGILTEKTSEALAEGMRKIHKNIAQYNRQTLHRYAVEHFSLKVIAKKLTELYLKCG